MRLGLTNSINRYAGGTWTPARLSGLIGWYRNQKPDNTDIFTASDTLATNGEDVHKWLDSSGNNSHITASSNFYQYNLESGGVICFFMIQIHHLRTFLEYSQVQR